VAGDPEVDDLRPVPDQQNVRRFEVPMHEPGAVNRHQRVGHTNRETCQDRPVESTTGVDRRGQAHAVDVVGGHPRLVRVDGVSHFGDEPAAHPAGGRDLPLETLAEHAVRDELR
jgi:hypothetical protein